MADSFVTTPLEDPVVKRIIQQAEVLDAIVSTMAQGVLVIDAQGLVVATNRQFRQMHNLPDDLCVPGNHFLDLARYAAALGNYGPGDPEVLAQNRWRAASAPDSQYRASWTNPAGLSIEVTGRSVPGGGFVNTYTDVTESLKREAALRETEARFRLLAEHSSDVVCLVDLNGIRQYVSPASERLLGWTPEQLRGTNELDFVHPEDRSILREAQLRIVNGVSESTALCRHRRPDNSWVWIEGRARMPLASEAGETKGYIVVLRDASERVHAEQLLRYALEQVEQMATRDGLTGLANRGHFDEIIEREWWRCWRRNLPISILMIDADHFKGFNDNYGHLAGDDCLRKIASEVAALGRRPADLAARFGGEEFVLLMPETALEGAVHVATRLCNSVQGLRIPHSGNPPTGTVTVSIGVASCSPGEKETTCPDVKSLVAAADTSLYRAKRDGRNRVAVAKWSSGEL
jgi:diguanylate cyclase (GGDEF)-like protein/PAS domain S-box-containing protein